MTPKSDLEFGSPFPAPKRTSTPVLAAMLLIMLACIFGITPFLGAGSSGAAPLPLHVKLTLVAIAVVCILAVIWIIMTRPRRIFFYDSGAVRTRFSRSPIRLGYDQCSAHRFNVVHHGRNGAYASTTVLLALSTHDGRSLRYRQTHLLRAVRRGGFRSVDFEIVERDPIELATWRSARVMASVWIARLDAGESIQWTSLATLTPTGIASWHGPSKGTIALYSELAPIEYTSPSITLRMRDGTRFLTLDTSDTNVHPGFLVMSLLIDRFSPD